MSLLSIEPKTFRLATLVQFSEERSEFFRLLAKVYTALERYYLLKQDSISTIDLGITLRNELHAEFAMVLKADPSWPNYCSATLTRLLPVFARLGVSDPSGSSPIRDEWLKHIPASMQRRIQAGLPLDRLVSKVDHLFAYTPKLVSFTSKLTDADLILRPRIQLFDQVVLKPVFSFDEDTDQQFLLQAPLDKNPVNVELRCTKTDPTTFKLIASWIRMTTDVTR